MGSKKRRTELTYIKLLHKINKIKHFSIVFININSIFAKSNPNYIFMKLKIYPLIVATLCLISLSTSAKMLIRIQPYESGATPTDVAISDISQIKFDPSELSILYENSTDVLYFDYRQIERISFINDASIEAIENDTQVVLSPNPARDILSIRGGDELLGSDIKIFSATGAYVMGVAQWDGNTINVSHLPSGVYFINIQNTTLKFIKL